MDTEEFSILTINLFRHSENSFITALDDARVPHGRMQAFTCVAEASPIVEVISAPSPQMPWNAIAEAIVLWAHRKPGREVIISTDNGASSHVEGCSILEINDLLRHSVDITVLDSLPGKPTSRKFRANSPTHKMAS